MEGEDIGWIKANITTILTNQDKHDLRLKAMEDQLNIYKSLYKAIKFCGMACVALMAWKAKDLPVLWKTIYGG